MKPKEHILVLKTTKIVYKLQLIREYVVSRRQIDIASNYVYHGSRRSVCMSND